VWLDFGGAADLTVAGYHDLAFAPFEGALISESYGDATNEIRQAIVETLAASDAEYAVTVLRSDQTPRPSEPHATIYFGGSSESQLGAADNVDAYNADPTQSAIVFVESFGVYETMRLPPEEMGRMIGNVASHELGHLVGLYHVCEPDDPMVEAQACSAYDMAAPQRFGIADLLPCVFPVGRQNAPLLLEATVGLRP
jgi:hypothetical protein